jgi:hypothetical protein
MGISKVKQLAKEAFLRMALKMLASSAAMMDSEVSPRYQNLMKSDCSGWI